MMKILCFLCLLVSLNTYTQNIETRFQAPDYKQIKKNVSQKNSKNFYSDLMFRWKNLDTTLNYDEFIHLYYGYVFQDTYAPYYTCPYDEKLKGYMNKESLTTEEVDSVIKYSELSIDMFPFDLRKFELLVYANRLKEDSLTAERYKRMLFAMIDVILSTGDGQECSSGFHVISISHEYYILNLYGFNINSQALIDNCDYLELEENRQGVKGIYFNVEQILNHAAKLFD